MLFDCRLVFPLTHKYTQLLVQKLLDYQHQFIQIVTKIKVGQVLLSRESYQSHKSWFRQLMNRIPERTRACVATGDAIKNRSWYNKDCFPSKKAGQACLAMTIKRKPCILYMQGSYILFVRRPKGRADNCKWYKLFLHHFGHCFTNICRAVNYMNTAFL